MHGDMSILAWLESLLPRFGARARAVPAGAPASPPAITEDDAQRAARATFDAGLAAYSCKDFAAAIACFSRVLQSRHDDADAHNNLGLSYFGLGRSEDAMDAFVLAIHFRPQFPQAFYNMA